MNNLEGDYQYKDVYGVLQEGRARKNHRNMNKYYSQRWGSLKTFQFPGGVFTHGELVLFPSELKVLLVIFKSVSAKRAAVSEEVATLKISHKTLIERTGYSKNTITKAINGLQQKNLLLRLGQQRRKYKQFGVNEYTILDSRTGTALMPPGKGNNLLYGNSIPYFTVPKCLLQEPGARWSLANMTGAEASLYLSALSIANSQGSDTFSVPDRKLRKLSALNSRTYQKSLESLQRKGLIYMPEPGHFTVCDPYTGSPFTKSPQTLAKTQVIISWKTKKE